MRVVILLALLLCVLAPVAVRATGPSSVYALEQTCIGWFCEKVEFDFIQISLDDGTVTKIDTVFPEAGFYTLNRPSVSSYISPDRKSYVATMSFHQSLKAYLLTYTAGASSVTKYDINYSYRGQNITGVGMASATEMVIMYGPYVNSFDITKKKMTPSFTAFAPWDPSTPEGLNTTMSVYSAGTVWTLAEFVTKRTQCQYIYKSSGGKTQPRSQCVNMQYFDMSAYFPYISGYNGTDVFGVQHTSFGNNLGPLNDQTGVYDTITFGWRDWHNTFPGSNPNPGSYLYDHPTGTFVMTSSLNTDTTIYVFALHVASGDMHKVQTDFENWSTFGIQIAA